MITLFSCAPGAVDYTDSFIVLTQALLATHRSNRSLCGAHASELSLRLGLRRMLRVRAC
jgi:hypothetical protein